MSFGERSNELLQAANTFEAAALDLQVPSTRAAAEQILLSFRDTGIAVNLAKWLLQHSANPSARFQAAVLMQQSAVRQWHILPTDERQGPNALRGWILHTLAAKYWSIEAFERNEWIRSAAILTAQAFEEEGDQSFHSFLENLVNGVARHSQSRDQSLVCLEMLTELMEELTVKQSKSEETPVLRSDLVSTERKRNHFMFKYGIEIFCAIANLMASSSAAELSSRCVLFLEKVLASKLCDVDHFRKTGAHVHDLNFTELASKAMQAFTLMVSCLDQVGSVYDAYDQSTGQADISRASCREVITQLASVSPELVPNSDRLVLKTLSTMEQRSWAQAKVGEERLAYAQTMRNLFSTHGLVKLQGYDSSIISGLAQRTVESMESAEKGRDDEERSLLRDTRDLLLEGWAAACSSDVIPSVAHVDFGAVISSILRAYASGEMAMAEAVLYEDEDEPDGVEDESPDRARYESAASLARATMHLGSLQFFAELLSGLARIYGERMQEHVQQRSYIVIQEQCYQMVLHAAYILADQPDSGDVRLPHAYTKLFDDNGHESSLDKVRGDFDALFRSVLEMASAERSAIQRFGAASEAVSPRVSLGIIEALKRLSATYLFNGELERKLAAGNGRIKSAVVEGRWLTIMTSVENVTARYEEPQLAEHSCELLLTVARLVFGRRSGEGLLEFQDDHTWSQVSESLARSEGTYPSQFFSALNRRAQRSLAETLLLVNRKSALVLVVAVSRRLEEILGSSPTLPASLDAISAWVNYLIGGARSPCMREVEFRHLYLDLIKSTLARMMGTCGKQRIELVADANKLGQRVCESFAVASDDAPECLRLVESFAPFLSTELKALEMRKMDTPEETLASVLSSALKLLGRLLEVDGTMSGSEQNAAERSQVRTSTVVLPALSALWPMLTSEIMNYPKMRDRLSYVVSKAIFVDPGSVCEAGPEFVQRIVTALIVMLRDVEMGNARRGFEATEALAKHMPSPGPRGTTLSSEDAASICTSLMQEVLRTIFTGDGVALKIPQSCDALMSLLCWDRSSQCLSATGDAFSRGIRDDALRGKMREVFETLYHIKDAAQKQLDDAGGQMSARRSVKSQFRHHVAELARTVPPL